MQRANIGCTICMMHNTLVTDELDQYLWNVLELLKLET